MNFCHDLKFSAVLGTTSANNSIFILPAATPPIVKSKKTTGFFGFWGLVCQSGLNIFGVLRKLH